MHTSTEALLRWYDTHARRLPWREATPDPYRVWLSEIMLQQTTTTAVAPYFARFLTRWPNVIALADAADADVMQAWAGLGYYARARNLLACARTVRDTFGGRFPDREADLRALPGIGAYTAAAIAAIAFGRRAVVVDGNVERVVSRLCAIETPLPTSRPDIRRCTDTMTPDERAGDFAQAMMDLGATICTPTRPACILCPLADACIARARGLQDQLPRKLAKPARPARIGVAFVGLRGDGAVLTRTRPLQGLLGGMSEFPGAWPIDDPVTDLASVAPVTAAWKEVGRATHGFTHFDLVLRVFRADQIDGDVTPPLRWVTNGNLGREAFPTLMRKVATAAELLLPPLSVSAASEPAPAQASARTGALQRRPRQMREEQR